MSKTLKTVAVIAGAVALVAVTAGAAAGALAPALAGTVTVAGVSTGTLATIGAIASVASTVASYAAQATAKKPPARGSVNQVLIASDAPSPYLIGRTYTGGILRHDVGYGPTLKKVPNPYRAMVLLYSVAGPLQGLEAPYFDYAPITINSGGEAVGYYNQFLNFDYRVGNDPDSALIPHYSGMPGWSSAHKLSSNACALWNLKFDKDGKRFASGVPAMGAVWNGVKVYDPRLDSTYPGGSGSQRIDNEATWTFSENPGLHALAYARGRYRNGKKVFGIGMPPAGIVIEHFVALANVCDANGWKVGGIIYEPGDRWNNLKDILQAGGAEPGFVGGRLGLKINAPRVALDTITAVDLAEDDAETTAMQSWRNRLNGIIPKYRSEAHKWDYVPSDLVTIPAYVAEDGEEKNEEVQYNLVQQKNQAAQLAAYDLVNGREISPIVLVCKPRLREYGMGDMLTLNLPIDHGLANVDAVIVDRTIDPATMKVTLTFMSETAGKHDFALGRTGTAPPTPSLTSPQDRDDIAAEVGFGTDGSSAFTLVNLANTTIGPNFIEKTSGSSAWDASAHSGEFFTGGAVFSFTVPDTANDIFVGFNSDPTTDASYASIDYALRLFRGTLETWHNGSWVTSLVGYSGGDRFQGTYDNRYIRLWKNGTVIYTVEAGPGLKFALDTSFADTGGRIENITWAAAGPGGADGTDGITFYEWTAYADSDDGTLNFTIGPPDGRTFQGKAPGRTTPTEGTDPDDYQWSSYVGPPNFGLVAGANMKLSGARLFKVSGSYDWNAQVYSSESFTGGAYVSFRPEIADQMMIGLNTDPLTNASYNSLDHAIYVTSSGYYDCRIGDGGTVVYSGTWTLGDSFAVHYRGNAVDYKKNGVTVHTVAASGGQTFWLDSSFCSAGYHNATILAWSAAGGAGNDGDQGDPGYSVAPPAWALGVNCFSNGTKRPGALPKSVTMYAFAGSEDISEEAAVDYTITTATSATASLSGANNRVLTISDMPDDPEIEEGLVVVTITRSGTAIGQIIVRLNKVLDGTTAAPVAQSIPIISLNGTTGPITKSVANGASVIATARMEVALTGARTQSLKVQSRLKGAGSWTDVPGASGSETDDSYIALEVSGSFTNSSGATALYEFQAVQTMSAPSGTIVQSGSFVSA